ESRLPEGASSGIGWTIALTAAIFVLVAAAFAPGPTIATVALFYLLLGAPLVASWRADGSGTATRTFAFFLAVFLEVALALAVALLAAASPPLAAAVGVLALAAGPIALGLLAAWSAERVVG